MKTALIFNKDNNGTVGIYYEKAMQELGVEYKHFWTKNAYKIPDGYDLYLRIDHGDYTYDLPGRLHPKVFVVSDTHLPQSFKKIKKQVRNYDLVFCYMQDGTRLLKRMGVNAVWTHFGCDPDIHKKLNFEKIYEVGFVGNDGGVPRKFLLQEIKEQYPDSYIDTADYTLMSEIYSKSKIGVNYSIRKETMTMRAFEIMSCGAMLLVNQPTDESIEKLGYKDRKHLVIYHSPKELFELLKYYLDNDKERERIAEQGYKFTIENHTYKHRLKNILEIIERELKLT